MSILIRGMDMPKSCGFCVFEQENGDGCECYVNGCLTEYQKRPDDCPLIPVPPHGRLIEKHDVFKLISSFRGVDKMLPVKFMKALYNLPTIIPADEPFGKSEQLNL